MARVLVWEVPLDLSAASARPLLAMLSDDERARAVHFRHAVDRRQFIAAHGALRMILGDQLGLDPSRLVFHMSREGKPRLGGPSPATPVFFNLCHTRGLALIATCEQGEVGIDVEWIRPIAGCGQLTRDCFSSHDLRAFSALSVDEQSRTFLRWWVRKEALLKAAGAGIQQMEAPVDVTETGWLRLTSALDPARRDWRLADLDVRAGYIAAAAVHGREIEIGSRRCLPDDWFAACRAAPLSFCRTIATD